MEVEAAEEAQPHWGSLHSPRVSSMESQPRVHITKVATSKKTGLYSKQARIENEGIGSHWEHTAGGRTYHCTHLTSTACPVNHSLVLTLCALQLSLTQQCPNHFTTIKE